MATAKKYEPPENQPFSVTFLGTGSAVPSKYRNGRKVIF